MKYWVYVILMFSLALSSCQVNDVAETRPIEISSANSFEWQMINRDLKIGLDEVSTQITNQISGSQPLYQALFLTALLPMAFIQSHIVA